MHLPDANMGDVMVTLIPVVDVYKAPETGARQHHHHCACADGRNVEIHHAVRSITGGRGYFSMEFDHYDTVPSHIAGPIIEAHKKEMEAKKEE
ncbi:MAG: hypothetical protein IPP55_04695 [Anaerolineales bacterium]|nr:hypothetical protein [Anaerolineales bacterium]